MCVLPKFCSKLPIPYHDQSVMYLVTDVVIVSFILRQGELKVFLLSTQLLFFFCRIHQFIRLVHSKYFGCM